MRTLRSIALVTVLLAAGASPALAVIGIAPEVPTTTDRIEVLVLGSCVCGMHFDGPPRLVEGNRILLKATTNPIIDPPIANPYAERFVMDPLPAGDYRVDFVIDGKVTEMFEFLVVAADPADPFLRFGDARLTVKVEWKNPWGPGEGTGKPIVLTPLSGYFYFFDRDNVELTVKLLDGRPVNGRWWLFIASMTTLEMEIEVTQCPLEGLPLPCMTKTYVQPPGKNRNFVDTSTFSF